MSDERRAALHRRIAALIASGDHDDAAFDALLADVLSYQRDAVPAYARLVTARAPAWPALPTDVFRFARIATHAEVHDTHTFRTSGTTHGERGVHAFSDMRLYDLAAESFARYALFPDHERMTLVVLAPSAHELPDSSLSYMLDRFHAWFGTKHDANVFVDGRIDTDSLERELMRASNEGEPVALLGTSFAFVHAEDALGARNFRLPAGSRIMQTGGFKGRSREIEPENMRAMLAARYGVPDELIIAEYGMTELSSQMYESTLRDALSRHAVRDRHLLVPGWVRATPVDPDTCAPVVEGAMGILRIDDLANLGSCAAIQTADLAIAVHGGIVLHGRAPGAVPRGCSLAMDEALSGDRSHA